MTPSEFKAWFDGFTECMEGQPTEKQWKRIKKRVSEIDDLPITRTIFNDYYVRPYRPYFPYSSFGVASQLGQTAPRELDVTAETPQALLQIAGRAEYASTVS